MSRTFQELTPQNFSFNSPLGWCPACEGLGVEAGADLSAIVANPNLTLVDGAVSAWPKPADNPPMLAILKALAEEFDIPLDVPWYQLSPQHQRIILQGSTRSIEVLFPKAKQPRLLSKPPKRIFGCP